MTCPFSFKSTAIPITPAATSSAASSWPWPICATNPRTLSFTADNIYKTINPAYLEDDDQNPTGIFANATPEELIPNSPQHYQIQESAVISGLRSDRLFFEPGATSSILEEAKEEKVTIVEIDSRNPFVDFRVSMKEMVKACGWVRDWEFLEELLEWYLRVNDESIHGCIVGAFVDLLIHLLSPQHFLFLHRHHQLLPPILSTLLSPFLHPRSTKMKSLDHKNGRV